MSEQPDIANPGVRFDCKMLSVPKAKSIGLITDGLSVCVVIPDDATDSDKKAVDEAVDDLVEKLDLVAGDASMSYPGFNVYCVKQSDVIPGWYSGGFSLYVSVWFDHIDHRWPRVRDVVGQFVKSRGLPAS